MICLDTNAVIAVLNSKSTPVRAGLFNALAAGQTVAISLIVLFELHYGAAKSRQRARNEQRLTDFLTAIAVLPFEAEDACEAGEIRAFLEMAGHQ